MSVGTAEICLLIMALYTLVLLVIAAQYSSRTIDTLGGLVRQLIEKIDSHNETFLKDIRELVSVISGHPDSVEDEGGNDNESSDDVSDMQFLYENTGPSTWTRYTRTYEPVGDSDVDVSKTAVINPYDKRDEKAS